MIRILALSQVCSSVLGQEGLRVLRCGSCSVFLGRLLDSKVLVSDLVALGLLQLVASLRLLVVVALDRQLIRGGVVVAATGPRCVTTLAA